MDRATKNKILIRYVSTLEDKHGSVGAAEENGDKQFKEMREFIKQFFNDRGDEQYEIFDEEKHHWTEEEVKSYLKEHYATKNTKEIADELGMSPDQVRFKAWYLGLKKPKNDKTHITSFIIKNYKTMSRNDMSKATGLSYSGVNYYLKKLKAEGKISGTPLQLDAGRMETWTKKEKNYLVKHYPTTDTNDVAKALGRTDRSVRSKAYNMGIKKK